MRVFVRNKWKKDSDGRWYAVMVTAEKDGYNQVKLSANDYMEFEVTGARRCTGYWNEEREMVPCPNFAKLKKGSQCRECKSKDIYSSYVEGEGRSPRDDEEHSVYLAQIGSKVKVGVARKARLQRRWIEQGADYAAEIKKGLDSMQALEYEKEISNKGFPERIRKENKLKETSKQSDKLEKALKELGSEAEIREVREKTIYPKFKQRQLQRTGLFSGEIQSIKGNIIATRNQAIALTEGKVLEKPAQQGLNNF